MSLLRRVAIIAGGTTSTAVIGVALGIVISRVLGPEGTGKYQLAHTLALTVVTFLFLGVGQSNIYFLNKWKADPRRVVANSLLFSAVFGLVAMCVILALFLYNPSYTGQYPLFVVGTFAVSIPFFFSSAMLRKVLIAEMRVVHYSLSQIIINLLMLLSTSILALLGKLTTDLTILCLSSAFFIDLLVLLYFLRRHLAFPPLPDLSLLWKTIRYGLQFYMVNMMVSVNQQLAVIVLGIMLPGDFDSIGLFARAVTICGLIRLLAQGTSVVLYSHWSAADPAAKKRQVAQILRLTVVLNVMMVSTVLLFGEHLIVLMYGREFLPAYAPLRILVFQQALAVLSKIFQSFFSGSGKPYLSAISMAAANVASAVGMVLLIPEMGIVGAAYAVLGGQVVCITINLIQARYHYRIGVLECLVIRHRDLELVGNRIRRYLGK